jgi:outer membrane protein assembly factor BamB
MTVAPAEETSPAAFDFTTSIFDGTTKISSYSRPEPIEFGPGKDYTSLQGIVTFRGNNYREGASYGTAAVITGTLKTLWQVPTGSVTKSSGTGAWTGSGWTGQPLIVKWPEDIKAIMNLYPEKKADPDLVEVIYACLDGKIYFLDLKDGTPTRPPIKTGGGPTKGTASLYPNGIPMLFVGQGDALPASQPEGVVKYRIYSLIDQKLMYTFGTKDPVAYRKWQAYDSSALIDVKTDTLIEPGENGLLYTIKLNTKFDKAAGTLSIDPEKAIRFRYTTPQYKDAPSNTPSTRWWGMEDSPVAWHNYLYVSDNGGKLMCIDLNTMKLVWAQNILDDSNSTPLFEESIEDNTAYIYISTSLRITAKGSDPKSGGIPIWKINAATGEIVWQSAPYKCYTVSGVSGGVEGTGVLGKNDISNLVIYPVARTPEVGSGLLVALDKATGAEVWRFPMDNYAWSSPVAVYTAEGKSYIVICDSKGYVFLLEGKTGRPLSSLSTSESGSPIEASPAVFGNTIVIGTRGERIFGIRIQ